MSVVGTMIRTHATVIIIQQVKGDTSWNLRDKLEFSLPSPWTRTYFVSSVDELSGQTIEE